MLKKFIIPLLMAAALVAAYQYYSWQGVAFVGTGLVFWLLLHFNRTMQVLKRAANLPIGYVDSAVMLNAKLNKGVTLMHVIALTKSLGEQQSPKDAQPELFRWTDGTQSHVTCTFDEGKLSTWVLWRPELVAETVETPVAEVKPSVL